MPQESIVRSCYEDLAKVVELLQKNEQSAREFFNSAIYPRYAKAVSDDSSPLRPLFFFFAQLDEYLNSQGFRTLGQLRANDIVGSFRSDFRDDFREALEKEKGARADGCPRKDSLNP